jgi:UV DNA damage endonuclease
MTKLRLGLCCLFKEQPIKFRQTTARYLSKLGPAAGRRYQDEIAQHNLQTLAAALKTCRHLGIRAFRISSQLLPLATHPDWRFDLARLQCEERFAAPLQACRQLAIDLDIRLSMHPDQFVVLSSPRSDVVASSLSELEYQGQLCHLLGADVLNIHAGGAYGCKPDALARFARNLDSLSEYPRRLLTLENDDRSYAPQDLLPFCERHGIPLVYDVHHHRCNPDELSVEDASAAALATWDREPHFHISSPLEGWAGPRPQRHHDFIDVADLPTMWLGLDRPITVDVEAKAKEIALAQLQAAISLRMTVGAAA